MKKRAKACPRLAPRITREKLAALNLCDRIARCVVTDYRGLPIGDPAHQIMTDQLEQRLGCERKAPSEAY